MPRPIVKTFTPLATTNDALGDTVTGASWALTTTSMSDGMAHVVTVTGNQATDHSAKTLPISGTDADNKVISETINLPNGTAVVSTTKNYKTVNTPLVPSSSIGADTMDIGYTAAANSPTLPVNYLEEPFNLQQVLTVTGTINCTVQHTSDDCWTLVSKANWFDDTTIDDVAVNTEAVLNEPVRAIRLQVNSVTATATATITLIQGQGE